VVVQARTEIGDNLEPPALTGTVQLQHLLLPLEVILLVMAGYAGVSNRAPSRFRLSTELWA
jgi:hypothetical protein